MRRAIEAARTEDERVRIRFGAGDVLLQRLVGLRLVDEEQDRIGDDACERNEMGTGDLDGTDEQLVDLGVAGDPRVVRQQGVSVGLGRGGKLRAHLARGAGLGFDHDRLLEDRLHRAGQRPRHDVVEAAGRERVDDGDGMRGKSLLGKCRSRRECGRGGADDETTAIHALPPQIGMRPMTFNESTHMCSFRKTDVSFVLGSN